MQLPTAKDRLLQFLRLTKAGDASPASFDSARSWPAPGRKSNELVLKRSPGGVVTLMAQAESSPAWPGAAPFPAPIQEDAFAMPRPVTVVAGSSPWPAADAQKSATMLRAAAPVRAEIEFSRPPFLEKKSARHPGGLCRSC
jgi:hypothetical protein